MPTRRVARYMVYSSIVIGLALLIQLYYLVPAWLFYIVLAGWIVYFIVAIEVARGLELAYPSALVMSILTLMVSLPQPEHYSLLAQGLTLASLTLVIGSAVQGVTIIFVGYYLVLRGREARLRNRQE